MYNRWLVPLCFFNSDDICSFQHTRLINTSWISNQRYPEVKLANVRESVCKYTIFKRCHLNGEAVIFDNSWLPLIAKWPQFTRGRSPPVSDMVNPDRFQRYLTYTCVHCKVPISEWNDNPCFNCSLHAVAEINCFYTSDTLSYHMLCTTHEDWCLFEFAIRCIPRYFFLLSLYLKSSYFIVCCLGYHSHCLFGIQSSMKVIRYSLDINVPNVKFRKQSSYVLLKVCLWKMFLYLIPGLFFS